VLASQEGAELFDQQQVFADINRGMDGAQGHVNKAIEQEKDVQEMSKGPCFRWLISILFLISVIVATIL
jgi:hypothetical protein